jgi:hypothetical protein
MITSIFPFDNADNYSYLTSKIEVLSGKAQLFPIVSGAEAYIYAKLDENQGLVARDSSGNQRDGAFQGGLDENAWTTGKINSAVEGIGITNGYINFNGFGNFATTQAFSLECWIKFTSTATQTYISKQINSGNFEGYAINCLAGKPRAVIRDDLGNVIAKEHNVAINDNSWHHVVFTYNGSGIPSGVLIYVDNVLNSTTVNTDTLSGTITNTANLQISGRDGNNLTLDVGTIIDEVVIYDRELTAAEIAFRWNTGIGTQQLPGATTAFPTDNPTIETNGLVNITKFNGLSATIVAAGGDEIRAVMNVNGIDKYWNSSAWVNSSGYSESNTIADINTNAASLVSDLSGVAPKFFLHSNDGSTTPEILDFTMIFDFGTSLPLLNENIVYASLYDFGANPLITKNILVQATTFLFGTNSIITSDFILVPVQDNGFFEAKIYTENVEPTSLKWVIADKVINTNFLSGIRKFSELTIL